MKKTTAAKEETKEVSHDLVTVEAEQPVNIGLLQASTPDEMVKAAEAIATPLARIISDRRLYTEIQGRKHVRVEGWTTMLAMLGIVPVEKWAKTHGCDIENPITKQYEESTYYEVYVELRRARDGQVIGGASAECGGPDELAWHWRGRQRVAPNARRSMAGTRATGKAGRLFGSWIIHLAGYETTPEEEMSAATREAHVEQDVAPPIVKPKGKAKIVRAEAKYNGSSCMICNGKISKGSEIAMTLVGGKVLKREVNGVERAVIAHWSCYEEKDGVTENPGEGTETIHDPYAYLDEKRRAQVEEAEYEDDLPFQKEES